MGAPQGTKLGPWLWLVYINDLNTSCDLVKYADDLTMYASFSKTQNNSSTYQNALDDINKWATDNDMTINAKKSKVLHVSFSQPKYTNDFTLGGNTLEKCESAKLLGVTLDRNLTFSDHVKDVCSRLASKLYGMRVLKRLGRNSEGLKTYYIANIRSVLTYASPVWASLISDNNMTKLIQIEKSAMKIIDADFSYQETLCKIQLPPLDMVMDQASRKYIMAIYGNKNHPLHKNIELNTQRKTRVSSLTSMP